MDYYNNEQNEIICTDCKTNIVNRDENTFAILCNDCKVKFLKFSVPIWVRSFLFLILIMTIISSFQFHSVINTYKAYLNAEEKRMKNEFSSAYDNYIYILEQYNNSVPMIINAIDSAMGAQYFDGVAYLINTYLVGKTLDDVQHHKVTIISELLEKYYNTFDKLNELFESINISDDFLDLNEVQSELLQLLNEEDIDKTYVYFMLGNFSPEPKEQLHYLQLATQENSLFTYPLAYYGNALRRNGDFTAAMNVYNEALNKNANDTFAIRGIGIVEQLQGNKQQGLENIQKSYDINPEGQYIVESMIIALCESGRREEAMLLLTEKEAEDYSFEEDLYEYLNGTIAMEQYYKQ